MADIASPLFRLTRKGVKWDWDESCERSYAKLCETLEGNPVTLAYPSWSEAFHVEADAFGEAVGGVLSQMDRYGRLKPITFFSYVERVPEKVLCRGTRNSSDCSCGSQVEEIFGSGC